MWTDKWLKMHAGDLLKKALVVAGIVRHICHYKEDTVEHLILIFLKP